MPPTQKPVESKAKQSAPIIKACWVKAHRGQREETSYPNSTDNRGWDQGVQSRSYLSSQSRGGVSQSLANSWGNDKENINHIVKCTATNLINFDLAIKHTKRKGAPEVHVDAVNEDHSLGLLQCSRYSVSTVRRCSTFEPSGNMKPPTDNKRVIAKKKKLEHEALYERWDPSPPLVSTSLEGQPSSAIEANKVVVQELAST